METSEDALERGLSFGQGLLYVVTGVWPVLSIRTFMAVTGPKRDQWLVKATGMLIAVAGAVLTLASARNAISPETEALGAGTAATLGAVDVIYVRKGILSRVYLLDAAFEAVCVLGWLGARLLRRTK